ncbi:NADPH-dependent FMN reductase [Pleionea sp. CnH1-48]|uniref:NADPH-dependent FMN reductase n=1 Tax=Pleionea sp. CnH1-48 TaxID=2954494 RepID=UPI0020979CB1|nr:NAD(P)H-dependent oxidoreductase [Pleionea sp. CnH1-48]MCO7227413.1 NAD(P)H-dependent oxidoreductase [Pleionea sp. CnH1-48]
MKLLAFAASSSRQSINKQLVTYATQQLSNVDVEMLDLNDYEMPLYSIDKEQEQGIPDHAHRFYKKIGEADALLISFAEHNASYTAAFKNLYDWTSRIDAKVYQNKPMVMLATSPGPGGAKNVLATATTSAPYFGGELKGSLSIASFFDHFDVEKQELRNEEKKQELMNVLNSLMR